MSLRAAPRPPYTVLRTGGVSPEDFLQAYDYAESRFATVFFPLPDLDASWRLGDRARPWKEPGLRVRVGAAAYTGDAQLAHWPGTLEVLRRLSPEKLVPGRGPALLSNAEANRAIDYTKSFVEALLSSARESIAAGHDLRQAFAHARSRMDPLFGDVFIYEHCLPFDVSRAFDEASGISHPRIWTAERDREMWQALQD